MTVSFRFHPNAVASVTRPATLLVLIADSDVGNGWCDQFTQEGYNVISVAYPSAGDKLAKSLKECDQDIHFGSAWALITYGLLPEDAGTVQSATSTSRKCLKAIIHFCPAPTLPAETLLYKNEDGAFIPTTIHIPASQEALHARLLPYDEPSAASSRAEHHPISLFTYPLVPADVPFPLLTNAPADRTQNSVTPHIRSATNLSLSRTLTLLKRHLGPYFNLEKIWELHTQYEFVERDARKTLSTMVETPYVNHIATMTGGMGREDLLRFYKYHFTGLDITPPDTEIIAVSRTIGTDRIVDEMIFKCTHTTEIDYFLPGIPPTGKRLEFPVVGIIAFRGDKMYFEHIYWDQASVLVQLGLLDPTKLPVAGVEAARKVLDPFGMPSNVLLKRWASSEGLEV